ncbi:hypothetical protein DSO57_1021315 [Entomophthora muscae]|uniref:Uncharacterized protein n=1 Tax=Entomophthora muscae TaxID=34485 RepID=A0ACC2T3M8_9FUNG|nr:hypothetical protein DSO57_1021315 [Entomophthora muscae]
MAWARARLACSLSDLLGGPFAPGTGEDSTANMPSELVTLVGGGSDSDDGDSLHPSPSSFLTPQTLSQKILPDPLVPPPEKPHSHQGVSAGI